MTTSNTGADPVDVTPRDSDLNARDKMVTGAPHHVSPRTAPDTQSDIVPRDVRLVAARHAEIDAIPGFDSLMSGMSEVKPNPDKVYLTPLRYGPGQQPGVHADLLGTQVQPGARRLA